MTDSTIALIGRRPDGRYTFVTVRRCGRDAWKYTAREHGCHHLLCSVDDPREARTIVDELNKNATLRSVEVGS